MNAHSIVLLALLLALVGACEGEQDIVDLKEARESALVSDFTWDSDRLTPIPAGTIPRVPLPASAYQGDVIRTKLIQTVESATELDLGAGRFDYQSPSWHYSSQPSRGLVLAINKNPPGPPIAASEPQLQDAALQRLQAWGIRGGEIGSVWQRRLMATAEENGEVSAPARVGPASGIRPS